MPISSDPPREIAGEGMIAPTDAPAARTATVRRLYFGLSSHIWPSLSHFRAKGADSLLFAALSNDCWCTASRGKREFDGFYCRDSLEIFRCQPKFAEHLGPISGIFLTICLVIVSFRRKLHWR